MPRPGRPSPPVVRGLVAVSLLAAILLAGCSNSQARVNKEGHTGSSTASVQDGVQNVTLTVGDNYRFDPSTITVHPGKVKVTLTHTGTGAPHNFQIVNFPADFVPDVFGGQTSSATFTAPAPGSYTFVCTIHEKQGQTGTLIVLSS